MIAFSLGWSFLIACVAFTIGLRFVKAGEK